MKNSALRCVLNVSDDDVVEEEIEKNKTKQKKNNTFPRNIFEWLYFSKEKPKNKRNGNKKKIFRNTTYDE